MKIYYLFILNILFFYNCPILLGAEDDPQKSFLNAFTQQVQKKDSSTQQKMIHEAVKFGLLPLNAEKELISATQKNLEMNQWTALFQSKFKKPPTSKDRAKINQTCQQLQCDENLKCLKDLNVQKMKSCQQEKSNCQNHSDCCSEYCIGLDEKNVGVCSKRITCQQTLNVNDQCQLQHDLCPSKAPCQRVSFPLMNLNECEKNQASCSEDGDCCSNFCQGGKCVEQFQCSRCAKLGEKSRSDRPCCIGLEKNPSGFCGLDLPY